MGWVGGRTVEARVVRWSLPLAVLGGTMERRSSLSLVTEEKKEKGVEEEEEKKEEEEEEEEGLFLSSTATKTFFHSSPMAFSSLFHSSTHTPPLGLSRPSIMNQSHSSSPSSSPSLGGIIMSASLLASSKARPAICREWVGGWVGGPGGWLLFLSLIRDSFSFVHEKVSGWVGGWVGGWFTCAAKVPTRTRMKKVTPRIAVWPGSMEEEEEEEETMSLPQTPR